MNRRSDNALRQAISSIEELLLHNPSNDKVLLRCLDQMLVLLGASYGFAYSCTDTKEGQIPWYLASVKTRDEQGVREVDDSSTSTIVPQTLQGQLLSGRCFSGTSDTTGQIPLPSSHPEIFNYFCLPLVDARRIYGVIFICNCGQGFADDLNARLRPLAAAAGCLMRASSKKIDFQKTPGSKVASHSAIELSLEALDTFFNGIVALDDNDQILLANNAACSVLGLARREVIGLPISRFLVKGAPLSRSITDVSAHSNSCHANRKSVWRGIPLSRGDGAKILVDISAFELRHNEQNLRCLILEDISERLRSSADYHATLQRFQVLTNLAPVGILQLSRDWECQYVNDTWCEYCQLTPDEARGLGWLNGIHTSDADNVLHQLRKETAETGRYDAEFRLQTPFGRVTWVKANACCLYSDSGEISGLIMTFSDITEHLNNERRLQDIAERDTLTGLINRAFFYDRLEQAIKGIGRFGSVALMFLDLDEFKHVNDTLGHDAGDDLLKEVASRLNENLRLVDTIARIGGDEFTVLLTNVNSTAAVTAIADKLLESLAKPIVLDARPVYVTSSIGIAIAEEEPCDAKLLMKQADAALYTAKNAGRNQYRFYTDELNHHANLHIHLRQSLKERGRRDFRLVFQPQVDATNNRIEGVELLTRWSHPDAEPVGPGVFIKMIEESGLINDYSDWLFDEAFKIVGQWQKQNTLSFSVSINLSAKQFRNKDLAFFIQQRCQANNVSPRHIVLEVTETALIDDSKLAGETLTKLQRMGFKISLDDFGTGYSSLVYLRSMPLDAVKIDQCFIQDVLHDEEDAKIVRAILTLAETLDLKVIAEGVDNSDVKAWLIEHNCPIQQGYFFYKPLERDQFEKLMRLAVAGGNVVSINQ